jgi:hypothetical protein
MSDLTTCGRPIPIRVCDLAHLPCVALRDLFNFQKLGKLHRVLSLCVEVVLKARKKSKEIPEKRKKR